MPRPASNRVRKNIRLRPEVLARAQAALGTRTETETIEIALRMVAGDAPGAPADREPARRATGHGILKHFGTIPPHEADEMLRAIEDAHGRIDDDLPAFPD